MIPLSYTLDQVFRSGNTHLPEYKIYAFKPSVDSYSDIISDFANCTPLDITEYCSEIGWSPTQLSFVFKDNEEGNFNPDTGTYRSYLADGCIFRLREGDSRVDESEWIWTFTGAIKGQLGWTKNRKSKTLEAKVTVYSRENTYAWKRRKLTSRNYTKGADLGVMFYDICHTMGLTDAEIRVPNIFGRNFYFDSNQISQQAPWDALSSLLEVVMQVPIFDGEGRLSCYSKNLQRVPDKILPDEVQTHNFEVVARTDDAINKVKVTFLDSNLTKVPGPSQVLGTAAVTTGFFTMKEKLECWWSDDRKQRAENTWMKVIKSVNANLLPVGTESYQQNDLYHGTITVTIHWWVPTLATVMLLGYIGAAFIPDGVPPGQPVQTVPIEGTGVTLPSPTASIQAEMQAVAALQVQLKGATATPPPGMSTFTIPWGKVIQAIMMAGITFIMMCLGSAQYEIWGTPFDMSYVEKKSIAIVEGIQYYEENELEIKNDFIGTFEWADAVAITELCFQVSKAWPRKLTAVDFLGLEIGDIVQIYDGRKIFVSDIKKTIKRGAPTTMEINGFKVEAY